MSSASSSSDASPLLKKPRVEELYDVFISHAGPDKHTIAIPLRQKLRDHGISSFVDVEDMSAGCESVSAMERAMETAAIGVFILSPEFVARKWPVRELYCFLERAEKAALQSRQKPVLIPVFYRLTVSQCHNIRSLLSIHVDGRSPFADSRFTERLSEGEPEADLGKLQSAFTSLVRHMGIENTDDEIVIDSNSRMSSRERLVDKVVQSVKKALKKNEMEGTRGHASQAASKGGMRTMDSFTPRFDIPVLLPNMVMNWECNSDGAAVTMEGKVKKAIMDSTQDRDASVVAAVDCSPIGVCGHGGVGKTSALIGVGGEKDVQEHFRDGVYFVTVGRDATDGSMVGALALLVRECGGVKTCSRISVSESVGGAVQMTGGYFRGKRALFMFDDLWPTEKSDVGYTKEIRQLVATCPESRILISTRSKDVARAGRRQVDFGLRDAEGGVARDMLCCSAEIEIGEMLEYKEELGAVLRFCMGLPLTLQVAGCAIRELRDDGVSLRGAIESYVNNLQAGISRLATESGIEYPSFHETVVVSLRMADEWYQRQEDYRVEKERTVSELYERLAVLERQMHAPRSMLSVLWGLETERETEVVLKKLRDLNLVKRVMKGSEVGVEVHDLLLEYCEVAAGEEVKDYHSDLLSGYYKLREEDVTRSGKSRSEVGPWGGTDLKADVRCWWENGLSRGYIGENVCRHLAGAGKCEELAGLLADARWALAQVRRGRVMGWMGDFDELFGAMRKWKTGGADMLDLENARKGLELVRDGVRESWGYVKRNEREFGWQVYGRLMDQGRRGWAVRRFLESTSRHAEKPWLRPKSRCFAVPGGNSVVFPFDNEVKSVAILEKKAVVGVGEEVFIVNLESGERKKIAGERDGLRRVGGGVDVNSDEDDGMVTRRHEEVLSIAMSGDGLRIVCGYKNGAVRVWDVESGGCLSELLDGHACFVWYVAISGDGQRVVTRSADRELRVLDAVSGECVSEPLRDDSDEMCVAVSSDGRRVVFGSEDGTLKVWNAESGECVSALLGSHASFVSCMAMSGDGRRFVSKALDEEFRVWDVVSGECVGKPMLGHTDMVTCVAVSNDGRRVVFGLQDGTLRMWDAESGECVSELLRGHTCKVTCVTMSRDGRRIVSGSSDRTLRVWDARSRERVCEPLRGHTNEVWGAAMSHDGRRVVLQSDGTLTVWDAESETCVGELWRADTVLPVAVSEDGRRVVSGSRGGALRVWHVGKKEYVDELLRGHTGEVSCVALSSDGRRIVSGSDDKTLRVWDAGSGECVSGPLRGHTDTVSCVALSSDGRRIVSGSWDRTLRVWDAGSGTCVGEPLRGHTSRVTCVAMSWDGRRIVSGSRDRTLRVWNAKKRECVGESLRGHTGKVSCVALSRDGRRIVSGSDDKTLRVWYVGSGEYGGELLSSHTSAVSCVALSNDGRRIASGSCDGTLRVLGVGSGEGVGEPLLGHAAKARFMGGSGDGRRIVSVSKGTLRVWDVGTGKCVGEPLRGHTDEVSCVVASGDGRRIVSGSFDRTLRVWDAESGEYVGKLLRGHRAWVSCVAMSEDGRRVVSGSFDKTLRVWDAESGECVGEPLRGHTNPVWCVAMSSDRRRFVSGSRDGTLRVWDAKSGECVGEPLRGHTGGVTCVTMSEDGRRIVSGSKDGTLRVWDMNSGESVGLPQQHDGWVKRMNMTGTTVVAIGDFVPSKWKLDDSAGLVKVPGEDERDLLDVWCSHGSAIVKMSYQGQEMLLATLPAEVYYHAWHFDMRCKILVTGFDNDLAIWSEVVL